MHLLGEAVESGGGKRDGDNGSERLTRGGSVTRVYAAVAGDLFHYGHVRFLDRASKLGHVLVAGVHSDETIAAYERQPVMTMSERIQVVAACRFVDEVIPDAPLAVSREWIDEHRLDLVVHGDDLDDETLGLMYGIPRDLGILRLVPCANGISTSEIMERVRRRSLTVVRS
jgi:ethanolamine-phosphate cytidylyltransferase/choline-phosphate cytidylyltransferase